MEKITALKTTEISSKEHLKKFKPKELQGVIDVLNEGWFNEPVSSKGKGPQAKAIAELALGDLEFRNNYFEKNPDATIEDMFEEITKNTDSNNGLPESLTDAEYAAQELPAPMITPDEVDEEKKGLVDDILIIIQDLTGVDYLEIYGFSVEGPDDLESQPETDSEVKKEIKKEEVKEKKQEKKETKPEIKKDPEPEKEIIEEKIEEKKESLPTNPGEMGVHTIDLNDALKIVSAGLGREENENLIRFDNTYIRTYSSMISVLHPFVSGITGSVAGKDLVDLAKKFPAQDLNLSQTEDKLIIKGNKTVNTEFNFNTLMMPAINLPGEDAVWIPLPKDFSEMVSVAALSCSSKARNPIYNCVVVEKDSIVACENGHRGLEVVMVADFPGKLIIPGKMASAVAKYHPFEVCIDNSYFHFKNAHGTIISLRQYATGEFSQEFYDNLDLQGIEATVPSGIKQLVERSGILAGKGFTDYVSISILKGKMVISGRSETGCNTEVIKLENNEVEVEFAIHPTLFKEIIGIVDVMEVCENYILFKGDNVTCWISKTVPAG